MDLFSGTVENYRRHRSGIPAEVVALLVAETRAPAGRRRLLDLGTGTGFVVEALKNDFAEIVGVDPDAAMLAAARADVAPLPGQQISWVRSAAEDFRPLPGWEPDLVTVARAFHWFDQDAVLAALDVYVAPQGKVAVMGDQSVWTSPQEWKTALRGLVQSFLGERRRAGDGVKREEGRPFREILQQSAFGVVEEHAVRTSRQRDIESVIGYLHSTSFAAPRLFGDRLADFDVQAARLLGTYATDGVLRDDNEFSVLIARRALPPGLIA